MGNLGLSELLFVGAIGILPAAVGVGLVIWGLRSLAQIRRDVAALCDRIDALEQSRDAD